MQGQGSHKTCVRTPELSHSPSERVFQNTLEACKTRPMTLQGWMHFRNIPGASREQDWA